MAQDLRDLFKEEKEKKHVMKEAHELRFEARLERAIPSTKKRPNRAYFIAASIVLLVGFGATRFMIAPQAIPATEVVDNSKMEDSGKTTISLGDLSPDLKKIEQYYVTTINLELSELEVSEENKAMVDGYMERLSVLNSEYQELNKELNTMGPNDQTISALIRNLQLRLQLLYKLNDQLIKLKSSDNETSSSQSI